MPTTTAKSDATWTGARAFLGARRLGVGERDDERRVLIVQLGRRVALVECRITLVCRSQYRPGRELRLS